MTHAHSLARVGDRTSYLRLMPLACCILIILLITFCLASPARADGPPFTRQRTLVAGTTAMAAGDLNGDGALDIIATYGGQDIIYLNDGAGNFNGSLVDCAIPAADVRCFGPGDGMNVTLTVGDMNGDGALDIIHSGYDNGGGTPAQSVIYLNDGAGNFYTGLLDCAGPAARLRCFGPAESNIISLAVGDLDGNGALDIIAGANQAPGVIYLNDGAGHFYAGPVDCAALAGNARCFGQSDDFTQNVAVGDLDRDGDLDIVASTNLASYIFLNDGAGHFYAGPVDCAASLASVRCFGPLNDSILSLALGDVNADGALDIVTGSFNAFEFQPSVVYFNDGAANFYNGPPPCSTPPSNIRCFGPEIGSANVVALADIDSDGDLDIVLGNSDMPVTGVDQDTDPDRLYLNDGSGNFSAGPAFGLLNVRTGGILAGDWDGDGGLDVISTGGTDNLSLTTLFLNDLGTDFTAFRNLGQTDDPAGANFSGATGIAFGDMNGDGHLDVVVGQGEQDQVFLNDGAGNFPVERPFGPASYAEKRTRSIAIADIDGDNQLDIVVGAAPNLFDGSGGQDRVYLNDGSGNFYAGPTDCAAAPAAMRCFGPDNVNTASIAAGDMNGDGSLDLVVGNEGQPNVIYLNDGSGNFYIGPTDCAVALPNVHCFGPDTGAASSLVLGDVDGDGDLDIIAATSQQGQIYLNDGGGNFYKGAVNCTAASTPVRCFGPGDNTITSVAVGDMDGNGHLDVIAGTLRGQNAVYLNDGAAQFSIFSPNVCAARPGMRCFGSAVNRTTSLVVADFDGDGDLDIINGNDQDLDSQFFLNDGNGNFFFHKPILGTSSTAAVAAGDVNSDGALDIAVGYNGNNLIQSPSFVLLNGQSGPARLANNPPQLTIVRPGPTRNAAFFSTPVIQKGQAIPIAYTLSDAEGDPVGRVAGFYSFNGGGQWFPARPTTDTITTHLATAYSAQSTSPLAIPDTGSVTSPPLSFTVPGSVERLEITLNISHTNYSHLSARLVAPSGRSVRLFENLPGDGAGLTNVTFSDQSARLISAIEPDSSPLYGAYRPVEPLVQLRGEPLDGPYQLIITDITTGETGTLTSWSLKAIGVEHLYTWDTFASNILGQSDNVVLRLVAYPAGSGESTATYRYPHIAAGPNQRPYAASVTFPFRVRGAQVQVISGTTGIANAMVYRLPAGQSQGGLPLGSADQPFHTDSQGYLQGRGQIVLGDRLLALAPVPLTPVYTARYSDSLHLYYTNGTAAPDTAGLNAYTITQPGVQQLLVSPDNPLLLFDLDVSLEWDASSDPVYLQQLEFDLQRASEHLYDFSNGQVALGQVTIYQNKERWDTAHVRVLVTNRLRPFAVQGGIVMTETIDPDHPTEPDKIVYDIGQVVMGATWNRYGNAGQNLGQDWPLALAHELSHFLLFLDDTYLGLNDDGLLIAVDTRQPASGCTGSAMGDVYSPDNSEFIFDETFWQQRCSQTLPAQTLNRDEWATISLWYPWLKPPFVANPGPNLMPFDLTDVEVAPFTPTNTLADPTFSLDYVEGAVSSSEGQGFLFHNEDTNPTDYETIISLGSPAGGQNRLLARGARPGDRLCAFDPPRQQIGCEVISLGDERLSLRLDNNWTPFIQLIPINATTFSLTVTNLPAGLTLRARLYPDFGPPTAAIDLVENNRVYQNQFPAFEQDNMPLAGHIYVWAGPDTHPQSEQVVAFSIGGNPPHSRGGGPHSRGGGPHSRGGGAPLVSPDGQFIFFTPNPNDFAENEFYTIQQMAGLPPLPPGKKAIGPSYNLVAFPGDLDVPGSVSFQYLGLDALAEQADENKLTIHFWDGTIWRALSTYRDSYYNLTSAPNQGPGVYALLAGTTEPIIAAVTPSAETNEITRTITISGGYFLPPLAVALVGPTATYTLPLDIITPFTLTAVVTPALSAAEYRVRVVNGDGGISPTPGIFALYDPEEACFYDFLESGAGKWVRAGDWAITSLPSGEQVMTDSPAGPYKSAVDYGSLTYTTAITSLPFSLAACPSPTLVFEHAFAIVPNDAGRIEITADDGTTWQTLATYTNNSSASLEAQNQSLEWANVALQQVELGLNAYTGTVRLRFSLEVDQDVSAKGWVLDNIVVRSGEGSTPSNRDIFLPVVIKEK